MKKLIYCALALAAGLFAASCQQENLEPVQGGNTVTFTVEIPEVATKADAVGDKANMIDDLVYAVYVTEAESLVKAQEDWDGTNTKLLYAFNSESKRFENGTDVISLELLNNQNHIVLLWAQNADTWVKEKGNKINLRNITYPSDPSEMKLKAEYADKYAAFYAVKFIPSTERVNNGKIELTRPFAQINIATANPGNYNVKVEKTVVTVKGAGDAFDVAKEQAAGNTEATYEWTGKVYTDEFTVAGNDYDHYIAMNYVFANDAVEVSYIIDTDFGKGINNTISNVPVRKNYRTNIVGNLLTSDVSYDIVLDKEWGQPELAPDAIYLAAALGGEVNLTEDVVLTSPLEVKAEMTIYLNGKTISGEIEKGNGAVVNIADGASVILNGGTLKNTAANGDAAINNDGTLVLNGVTIEGAPLADGGYSAYAVISSGNMVIEEGTTISADRGSIKVTGAGETVINGGTFTNNDIGSRALTSHVVDVEDGSTHKLTINGGTFQHLHTATSGGVVICNRSTGTVYVNGGNFSGGNYYGNNNLSDYGYGGTFSVKGGVYDANPASKYIADGYKVIEKDGKYYVVTDNTFSSSDELNKAIKNAAEGDKIMLLDGTYTIDPEVYNKAGVTIIGAGENVTLDIKDQIYTINGTAAIENVKVVFSNNGYKGFQGGVDLNFKECTIEGQPFLYGTKATFEGCTFVQNDPEQYNVWTYAAKNVTFDECVFNCAGRSVLVYHEGNKGCTVTFNNTIFNASTPVEGKAAIEISSSQLADGELTTININGTTKANGFGNGSVSGNPLFNDKNGNKSVIIIDGRTYVAEGVTKDSEGAYYVSTAAGLKHMNTIFSNKTAGKNVVMNLDADIDFANYSWTPVDSHADAAFEIDEINGNGHTISNLTINGQAMFTRFAGIGDVVVKDITFDNATVNSNGSINTAILTGHTYQNVLLKNVDVKNSSITGGYKVAPLIGTVYNEKESAITATLKNCDVENVTVTATSYDFCTTGMVAFVYADDNDDIKFENCTVKNVMLYAPNVYTAHAAIYTTGSETLFNEAEGVTVTNVTFENI